MLIAAFEPYDPRTIDRHLSMEECAGILTSLKPRFIHHPECKRLLPEIIEAVGADRSTTYFDVPRLRSAYPTNYLTSGIAYAFYPHRDTWYSAPMCQLNWWIPIFTLSDENCLAFYPKYFAQPVSNTSETYNYAKWNSKSRVDAATHIRSDTRAQPRPQQEINADPMKIVCPPGGIIIFSGAHLHETVPNTSGVARYIIDFRTIHYEDAVAHRGAPNVDSRCTGTTMSDYLRCSDLAHLPDTLTASYEAEIRSPKF
jgi:hypothetical protein